MLGQIIGPILLGLAAVGLSAWACIDGLRRRAAEIEQEMQGQFVPAAFDRSRQDGIAE